MKSIQVRSENDKVVLSIKDAAGNFVDMKMSATYAVELATSLIGAAAGTTPSTN